MAQLMNEEQRIATLEAYNPKEHLIAVGKDKQGRATMYYPAAWRLYELNLRYPNANFKSEIIYMNEEKGTIVVKAYLYLGANYEASDKKAEAMKQGNINSLDKVETAAKARAARDFGIGTEYALDMVPDETDATHETTRDNKIVPKANELFAKGKQKGLWKDSQAFFAFCSKELKIPVDKNTLLSPDQRTQLDNATDEAEPVSKAS